MGGGSTAGTRGNGMPLERADTLATLLASVNDLVWCTSVDGSELLYVNTAAERIYGRPLDELIKNPDLWLEAIHPDDRDAVTRNLSRILKEREISQEYRIIRPDGEIRWLQDRLNVVCDSDGNTLCVGGIGTDITDRKRAEQALSESETVYRSLIENLPLNVLLKDLNGRLTFGNKSYCEMMGHPLSELLGKTDADLFPAEQAEKYRDDDRRVLTTDERFHDVEKHVTADGRSTYVEVLKLPVHDAAGDAIGVQCIFWDVTDRVQAQQQLVVAKEEAVAANSAKSDFLANMSHEIRTPMNAIIGMTELLQDTELADSQAEYVRMVNESGESLLSLINDILDFS
ncbi:MAG: PAS domain S-box protein, partial [Planctomycetaceae bacterium]|nr:PAS domain S-box protein [Planctomycetaceae bacterium]